MPDDLFPELIDGPPRYTENSLVFVTEDAPFGGEADVAFALRRMAPPTADNVITNLVRLEGGGHIARMRATPSELRLDALGTFGFDGARPFAFVEPERLLYLRRPPERSVSGLEAPEGETTWSLDRMGVQRRNSLTGKGAVVAVLDTGIDRNHPDFKRRLRRGDVESFVETSADDTQGHGTHCAGIIGARAVPSAGPRYSVAPGVRLLIAKVCETDQDGIAEWPVIAALYWAARRGAHIASLSMGTPLDSLCQMHSKGMEWYAKWLLRRFGMVIFAATGNANQRPGRLRPIHHPANCPSIVAVAALDSNLDLAIFSCGKTCDQRCPTVAAPGVDVRSCRPTLELPGDLPYATLDGTSQATPNAAGIAALWVERTGAKGAALIEQLTDAAQALPFGCDDVGAGLVQAP